MKRWRLKQTICLIATAFLAAGGCRSQPQPIPLFPEGEPPGPTPIAVAVPRDEKTAPEAREPAAEKLAAAGVPAGKYEITLLCHSDRDGADEIYLLDFGAGTATKLTDNLAFDGFASWSPNRERIVFVSERDGNREIYAMDADGDDPTRLTENDVPDSFPAWFPDGETIAFFSRRGDIDQLCLMEEDGDNCRVLTEFAAGQGGPIAVSPDGKTIAFAYFQTGIYKIFLIEDGAAAREIVAHGCGESRFCFAPDGQTLISASGRGETKDIWKYQFREGRYQRLTRRPGDDVSPTISPEADRIVFCSQRDGKNWQLYLLSLADDPTKNPAVRLTRDSASYFYPDWK